MTRGDGVIARVTGTVGNVFDNDKGHHVMIEIGRATGRLDRVRAWSAPGHLATGDRVTVEGRMTWRLTAYNDHPYVAVHLNDVRVIEEGRES